MKISVVIPVYNVKPYLERCVNSVLNQTFKDMEVILVDDGSTDGGGSLCDELAKKDQRIVVIHQRNKGLSGARNTGILKATGEYMMFLDSDDAWLTEDGLETLMNKNKPEYDLILFKNIDIWSNERTTYTNDYDVDYLNKLTDTQAVFLNLVRTQTLSISACFILIRRQILTDNNIFFPEGIISEDLVWSLQVWQHIQTVLLTNLRFYGYYHRKNSITNTRSNTLEAYESYDTIFSYWKKQCDQGCVNAKAIGIFMADMWVSRGYLFYKLQPTEKPKALAILKRHTSLLKGGETQKAKLPALLTKLLGVRITVWILSLYWRLKLILIKKKQKK